MVGFAGHAVFPEIYHSMEVKRDYKRVIITAYLVVGGLYFMVSICGYIMYGSSILQEITLNFSGKGVMSMIATWMTIITPATKFALALEPSANAVERIIEAYVLKKSGSLGKSGQRKIIVRAQLTFVALCFGLFVPHFDKLLEFIGSLCSYSISLTFPCICYLRLYSEELSKTERFINYLLIFAGISASLLGTVSVFSGPL